MSFHACIVPVRDKSKMARAGKKSGPSALTAQGAAYLPPHTDSSPCFYPSKLTLLLFYGGHAGTELVVAPAVRDLKLLTTLRRQQMSCNPFHRR
jgi:hypothetical protein